MAKDRREGRALCGHARGSILTEAQAVTRALASELETLRRDAAGVVIAGNSGPPIFATCSKALAFVGLCEFAGVGGVECAAPLDGMTAAPGALDGKVRVASGGDAEVVETHGLASATAGVHGGQRLSVPGENEAAGVASGLGGERFGSGWLAQELAVGGVAEVVVLVAAARVKEGTRDDRLSFERLDRGAGRTLGCDNGGGSGFDVHRDDGN